MRRFCSLVVTEGREGERGEGIKMEGKNKTEGKKKKQGKKGGDRGTTSSYNLADDLFGPKEPPTPPSSSPSLIATLFPYPSQVPARNTQGSWRPQNQNQGNDWRGGNGEQGSAYQNAAPQIPHYYSSSIYYGAQDICPTPSQSSQRQSQPENVGQEDDPHRRDCDGQWWEGSVYY